MGMENVHAANGVDIALTGMLIVFVALTLISLFIASLPRLLTVLNRFWPEPEGFAPVASASAAADEGVSGPVVAAIGYALHQSRRA